MVPNSGCKSKGEVEIRRVRRGFKCLFLNLDFKNLCVLVLHMWYIHVINNLRVLNNDIL